MIAIDTNVLVRLIVDDPQALEQIKQARELVKKATHVFVPQIVQVELVWVLESAYEFNKAEVIQALRYLLENRRYQLQHSKAFALALERFTENNAGFADALITVESEQHHFTLWTFDRKLGQQKGVMRLTKESLKTHYS